MNIYPGSPTAIPTLAILSVTE